MREITVATTQFSCSWDRQENVDKACAVVKDAAGQGAQLVVLQELFETPYFCINIDEKHFEQARPFKDNETIKRLQGVARENHVALPVSFYEVDGDKYYNSLAMIDADGEVLGLYRKSHIPDFPGYEEAYYFSPGDTGFKVFETKFGRVGAAICWDQWFPEAARSMAMMGAEVLIYPTAIGSEPAYPDMDSKGHWQRTMQGHAAANLVIVAAANRIGVETDGTDEIDFYGGSFIADHRGDKVVEASANAREVKLATFDLDAIAKDRLNWGVFRTRRHDLYDGLTQTAPAALTVGR